MEFECNFFSYAALYDFGNIHIQGFRLKIMLGSEYCSGYKDSSGEWNEGFYCPQPESKTANFCCGSSTFKFCCNAEIQDVILQDYGTDLETIVGQHPLELEE